MILHCTPPYWQNIPNGALGYLKGFLESREIQVKNVYWTLVLAKKISELQKNLKNYPRINQNFPSEAVIFYICRQLLNEDPGNSTPTTLDMLFSTVYSREELSEVIHSIKDEIDQYINQNNLHETPLAGFTMKTYQWLMSHYLIRRLKKMNPETKILIGGLTHEHQAFTFMKTFDQVDFAIWGEGEMPLVHFARALEEGTDIKKVPQLVYRDSSSIVSTKRVSELCLPLDEYPFADHSDYFSTLKKFIPFKKDVLQSIWGNEVLIPILGSRSCYWNRCKFCAINESTYRARSPESIVEEIEFQSKKYHVDGFFFVDSEVGGTRKRYKKILDLLLQSMRKRRRPYFFGAELSPLYVDPEIAGYMKRTRFYLAQIGFEAVADSLLEKMEKMHRLVHNIQALKAGNQYNLPLPGLNIIRGIPTESEEDIIESQKNLKFFRFLIPHYDLDPTTFMLFKGSPFYDEMSGEERETWREELLWEEIAPLHLIQDANRFEFFSFRSGTFRNCILWDTFESLLKFYKEQNYSYGWIESPQGSRIEEMGSKSHEYVLNRDETDILIYCDSIRTFSELKQEFSHLSEEQLLDLMSGLKDSGLLYYWKDRKCISVLEAAKRKSSE